MSEPAHFARIQLEQILESPKFAIAVEPAPGEFKLPSEKSWPVILALEEIKKANRERFDSLSGEIGGLTKTFANDIEKREPAETVFGVLNLGTEFLVDRSRGGPDKFSAFLNTHSAAWLFTIGWKILYDEVVMSAAQALPKLMERHSTARTEFQFLQRAVSRALAAGTPWTAAGQLDVLEEAAGRETVAALRGLIAKIPVMPGGDGPIYSMDQVQAVFLFISEF